MSILSFIIAAVVAVLFYWLFTTIIPGIPITIVGILTLLLFLLIFIGYGKL